jgi:K(+)-stimulated pyrophosphate-energized sodium pump
MDSTLLVLTFLLISMLSIGLVMLYKVNKYLLEKDQSHRISSLVVDGIKAFNMRAFSSIFQVLLYLSIFLFIFMKQSGQAFLWVPVLSSFFAGFAMCVTLFVTAGIAPKFIPIVIESSKGYLKDGLSKQFDIVSLAAFILLSIILLSFLFVYYFFSTVALLGFGLGLVFSSFFIRIGSGLFKGAIDVGKSLSTSLEKDLPADDERNLAVVLEISGDYIAKLSGFCSDILSSFVLSVIALIVFAESFENRALGDDYLISLFNQLPLQILAISILAALISYVYVKLRIKASYYTNILLESLYISMGICGLATYSLSNLFPKLVDLSLWTGTNGFYPFWAYMVGLIGASLISFGTEVLTSSHYPLSKKLASYSEYGSSIIVLKGYALALKSNVLYLLLLISIVALSYSFAGFYGIALSSLGILSVTPTIIIISAFGPFASSTHKVATLSTSSKTILIHTKKMEELGNSTIAIGNGFSAGTSILSTLSLFLSVAYFSNIPIDFLFKITPSWLVAFLFASVLPFIIAGILLGKLSYLAIYIKEEIKRQFQQIPYLLQGKAMPDVIKASDFTARKSMDALIIPGLLITLSPIILAYFFNIYAVVALALGYLISSIGLNFYWAVTGDVVRNAKHYVEDGHCGGVDSPNYKAIQASDAITSTFKDILSPSANILMKSIMILSMLILLSII